MKRSRTPDGQFCPEYSTFDERVNKTTGCWEWTGARTPRGYGTLRVNRRLLYAHRVAWEMANKTAIPAGLMICHKCDNPPCVRPEHLFLGTRTDNMRDAAAKVRMAKGWKNKAYGSKAGAAKLSERDSIAIRGLHATGAWSHRALGKRFGVSHCTIGHLLRGNTWKCTQPANVQAV